MPGLCDICGIRNDKIHRFPENYERALAWAKNMSWENEFSDMTKWKKCENIIICTNHFTQESYTSLERKRLVYGAMPTKCDAPLSTDRPLLRTLSGKGRPIDTINVDEQLAADGTNGPRLGGEPAMKKVMLSSQNSDKTFVSSTPSSQDSSSELFFEHELAHEKHYRREQEKKGMEQSGKKYSLLSHSSLLELLDLAPGCLKCKNVKAKRTFKKIGVVIEMTTDCSNCNRWIWSSTPRAHTDTQGSLMEGNIDISTCMFTSGIPYERCTDMFNTIGLGVPRRAGHYDLIKKHVKPVIDQLHEQDRKDVEERLQQNMAANGATHISCIGDAQFDTRGFSAEVCRYTMMEYETRLVVDYEVLIKRENQGNSPVMESRAFAAILHRMATAKKLSIGRITTDKNSAVVAHLKKAHPQITHLLDKWHILKGFKKNNIHIQLVRNSDLRAHWKNLLIHIWISIEAADGNGDLAVELIRSAEYHLQGVHKLPQDQFELLTECLHDDLPALPSGQDRAYLDPVKHSLQIKLLHEMLNNPVFLENVRKCAPRETTSPLESFHSLIALIYIPKNHYFDKETTTTLMKLAILHHNSHRRQILDSIASGTTLPVRMKYSKAQGRMRPVIQHPKPSMSWKVVIKYQVMEHYRDSKDLQETHRVLGRPSKQMQDAGESSDDEEENADDESLVDFELTDMDDESETEHDDEKRLSQSKYAADEEVSVISPHSQTTSSNSTATVYASALPKPRIGPLGARSFAKIYRELGADADKYEYFDRHGTVIVPIPTINDT